MNAKLKTLFSGIVAVSFAAILTLSCSAPNANNNYVPSVPGIDTPVDGLSSVQFASAMQSGWNLGNTFDSAEYGNKNNKLKASNGKSYETAWGMPETTEKMIYTVAAKGFKTIRIPISWHNHITDGDNYTIDPEWLARVKVVVDWARKNKMFVIINIHHDNLTSAQMSTTYGFSVNPDSSSEQETSKKYIKRIWEQVADYFKDYDNHVIFELLNEPRNMDLANPFNPSSSEESACNGVIKQYEQVALDAVRASGGNNANRFVMVPYYAASPWKNSSWSLPTDSASDKLLISTHAYDPYTFAMYDGSTDNTDFSESVEGAELKNLFDSLDTKWVSQEHGVVMGEGSCSDKGNTSDRLAWFKSYVAKAKAINCPLILWDNMATISTGATNASERHGYFNRNNCTWYFEELVNAMITTAGGTIDGNIPNGDGGEGGGSSGGFWTSIWSGTQDLKHWDGKDGITLAANLFNDATSSSKIRFTISIGAECTATDNEGNPCSNNYSTIHPITAWPDENNDGNITFPEANTNHQLSVSPSASASTVTITPDSTSWATIKSKGLIIYGHKVVITKIELM